MAQKALKVNIVLCDFLEMNRELIDVSANFDSSGIRIFGTNFVIWHQNVIYDVHQEVVLLIYLFFIALKVLKWINFLLKLIPR